jgi:hypothetical protein
MAFVTNAKLLFQLRIAKLKRTSIHCIKKFVLICAICGKFYLY